MLKIREEEKGLTEQAWQDIVIKKIKQLIKHGWGSLYISVSKNGDKIAIKQSFDDIIE